MGCASQVSRKSTNHEKTSEEEPSQMIFVFCFISTATRSCAVCAAGFILRAHIYCTHTNHNIFSRPFRKGATWRVTFHDAIKPTCVRRSWWMKSATIHQRPYQITFRILHLDCAVCNRSRSLPHSLIRSPGNGSPTKKKQRWKGCWRRRREMSDPSF